MRISDWSSDVCSSDLNLGKGISPLPPCGGGLGWGVRFAVRLIFSKRSADRIEHSGCIPQNIVVPETQDAEVLRFKPSRPCGIPLLLRRVLTAIEFDDKSLG